MRAAPRPVWRPGDPVRVKGDLKGRDEKVGEQPADAADALLARSRAVQRAGAAESALAPTIIGTNFDGITATGVLPPDTIGAVGPNHYIQMVNSAFAIYDKAGVLLAGPSQINSLWKGFGGPRESDNDGDPVARYDHMADRWLVSQFAIDKSMQCIAISRGPDPVTNGWFLYAFRTLDANGNPVTPDYPKIGVWPDAYHMSTQRGFPNSGMDVWAFERDKMIAGQPARQIQFFVAAPSIVLQPSDLTGPPPPAGTPNFFIRQVDGQRFGGQDRLEIFAFTANWTAPASSTFQLITTLPAAAFDSVLCNSTLGGSCVPQPGTNVRLHTLSVWPMFHAQYRNFKTHEVLLLNHTVDATGQDRAGVRWYELRRPPGGNWSIFQQATHSPDALHRWMGSLAMDQLGNIAVGYSVSSAQVSPGIRAATRRAADPPGSLGTETTIVTGAGSQTHPAARWGDYSSMDVDPARPCVFWFTTLYYASTSQAGWRTRIAEIRSPNRSPTCNLLVPNLQGMRLAQARAELKIVGLVSGAISNLPPQPGKGPLSPPVVVEQSPEAGTEVQPGTKVNLTLQRIPRFPL
ncbi:MAG TPA: PASTA domain-containing protein [Bryobacteraceae bacterium]|nr:PASTA domain-containing protein [Bryobacteraceae bacterium]